jgi:hypothetical protein
MPPCKPQIDSCNGSVAVKLLIDMLGAAFPLHLFCDPKTPFLSSHSNCCARALQLVRMCIAIAAVSSKPPFCPVIAPFSLPYFNLSILQSPHNVRIVKSCYNFNNYAMKNRFDRIKITTFAF